MAIQYVGGKTSSKVGATTGVTDVTINTGLTGGIDSAVRTGDLVIGIFATGSTADRTLWINDSSNAAMTLLGSELYGNDTNDCNLRVVYKRMGASPDTFVRFGPTGNAADAGAMQVRVYRGVSADTPFDGVTVTTATGIDTTAVNPPSITPATRGAWIFMAGAGGHANGQLTFATTPSYLSNFLTNGGSNDTQDVSLGTGDYTAWTSSAYDGATWTVPTGTGVLSSSWAALCAVLRPAPINTYAFIIDD